MILKPEQDIELAIRGGVDITTIKPRPETDYEQMEIKERTELCRNKVQ